VIFKVMSNFNDDFKMWVGRENLYTYSESPLYHLLLKLLEFFSLENRISILYYWSPSNNFIIKSQGVPEIGRRVQSLSSIFYL
jgi:hypothetical protein